MKKKTLYLFLTYAIFLAGCSTINEGLITDEGIERLEEYSIFENEKNSSQYTIENKVLSITYTPNVTPDSKLSDIKVKQDEQIKNLEILINGDQLTFTNGDDFSETYTIKSSYYLKNNDTGGFMRAIAPLPLTEEIN